MPTLFLLLLILLPTLASAGIQRRDSFISSIYQFKQGIQLPLHSKIQSISMPLNKIRARVLRSPKDPRVEKIVIKTRGKSLMKISEQLAKKGHTIYLYQEIKNALHKNKKEFTLTPKMLKHADERRLEQLYTSRHHRLKLNTRRLSSRKRMQLLHELKYFFDVKSLHRIRKKLMLKKSIDIDKDLLPSFASRVVRNYTIFRGPNCFHAALAFQDPGLPRSSFLNVKEEVGYHRAMINHDELWRVLDKNFYTVQPSISKLKFGDIIVFFRIPTDREEIPNFRWLKHTAVYLFNDYTFSKGSKSSNSPYTVKTLAQEWETWKRLLKSPAIKVFRRSARNLNKKHTADLQDWLYW
ncbi:MAG: hypothetical protein OYH77_00895 [Pseudomonadota bacterium]|nr:hypothetical protein [Pseudomonadota bacterium]